MEQVWAASIYEAVLEELTDTGNLLDGVKVHLFKNDFVPVEEMVLANFTEADYVGYPATGVALVWGTSMYGQDGNARVAAASIPFKMTASTTPNTIYGYYVTDAASAVLVLAARFPTPIGLLLANQGFILEVATSFLPGYGGDSDVP